MYASSPSLMRRLGSWSRNKGDRAEDKEKRKELKKKRALKSADSLDEMRKKAIDEDADKIVLDFLSKHDVDLLCAGGKARKFMYKNIIATEGTHTKGIIILKEGRVRVIKQGFVVNSVRACDIFGDGSFLGGVPHSASVIADENDTVAYFIPPDYIFALLEVKSGLGVRFFKTLAARVCRRLIDGMQMNMSDLRPASPHVARAKTAETVVIKVHSMDGTHRAYSVERYDPVFTLLNKCRCRQQKDDADLYLCTETEAQIVGTSADIDSIARVLETNPKTRLVLSINQPTFNTSSKLDVFSDGIAYAKASSLIKLKERKKANILLWSEVSLIELSFQNLIFTDSEGKQLTCAIADEMMGRKTYNLCLVLWKVYEPPQGLSEAQKIKRDNSVLLNNTLLGYDPLIDDPQVENAVVVKAFEASSWMEMSLAPGEVVRIHERDGDRWSGEKEGASGWFPKDCLRMVALPNSRLMLENTGHTNLSYLPTFKDWLILLQRSEERRFQNGEMVIKKGDCNDSVFFVTQGAVAMPSLWNRKRKTPSEKPASASRRTIGSVSQVNRELQLEGDASTSPLSPLRGSRVGQRDQLQSMMGEELFNASQSLPLSGSSDSEGILSSSPLPFNLSPPSSQEIPLLPASPPNSGASPLLRALHASSASPPREDDTDFDNSNDQNDSKNSPQLVPKLPLTPVRRHLSGSNNFKPFNPSPLSPRAHSPPSNAVVPQRRHRQRRSSALRTHAGDRSTSTSLMDSGANETGTVFGVFNWLVGEPSPVTVIAKASPDASTLSRTVAGDYGVPLFGMSPHTPREVCDHIVVRMIKTEWLDKLQEDHPITLSRFLKFITQIMQVRFTVLTRNIMRATKSLSSPSTPVQELRRLSIGDKLDISIPDSPSAWR